MTSLERELSNDRNLKQGCEAEAQNASDRCDDLEISLTESESKLRDTITGYKKTKWLRIQANHCICIQFCYANTTK